MQAARAQKSHLLKVMRLDGTALGTDLSSLREALRDVIQGSRVPRRVVSALWQPATA